MKKNEVAFNVWFVMHGAEVIGIKLSEESAKSLAEGYRPSDGARATVAKTKATATPGVTDA